MLEAAATALASLVVLGAGFTFGGYAYHKFYKWLVLHKMGMYLSPGILCLNSQQETSVLQSSS
jgi:hypothetical protein